MSNRPIAFFDSGVGGLTVMSKLRTLLPDEDFLYFGDTIHMPYGEKSKEELFEFADDIFKFFISKNAKAVVMACNTTSSLIYDAIKSKYDLKIYPIIQSVAGILANLPINTIGIFATPATVNSNVYKTQINNKNPNINVIQISCAEWVKIVEENRIYDESSINCIFDKMSVMLKNVPDKIVLGCTHYPYLIDVLSKYADRNTFIDPADYFVQFIKEDLEKSDMLEAAFGKSEIYVSANPELFELSAKRFLDVSIPIKLIKF